MEELNPCFFQLLLQRTHVLGVVVMVAENCEDAEWGPEGGEGFQILCEVFQRVVMRSPQRRITSGASEASRSKV